MTPPETDLVKESLAAAAGRGVASLARFSRGAQSVNYAGVWEGGGRFALKLVPFARAAQWARFADHLERVKSGPVVRECSPRVRFDVGGAWHAAVTEWCGGEKVRFDRVRDVPLLLAGYAAFSAGVQGVRELYPAYDYPAMRARVESSPLGGLLPVALTDATFAPLGRDRIVIHGDWQADNLRFEGGRLAHVLDIEEFRPGRPVEDFARYALCGAGRLGPFAFAARRRTVRALAAVAAASPYGADEWSAAIWGQTLEFLCKCVGKGRVSRLWRWRLAPRVRFCEKLEKAVRAAAGKG